jgi:polar amino acid transport system substrate-binding protein
MPCDKENSSYYGFAVLKGENEELLNMFNEGLNNLKESGEYDKILATYE